MLSDYLRSKAEWRRRQTKDFPNDNRNETSAAALESLAEYVEGPEASAEALARLEPHHFDEATLGGDRTWRAVARYGYGTIIVTDHHAAFLDELAVLCQLDAYTHAGEHGEDPTNTLSAFELEAAGDGVALPRRYFELRLYAPEEELQSEVKRHRGPPEE